MEDTTSDLKGNTKIKLVLKKKALDVWESFLKKPGESDDVSEKKDDRGNIFNLREVRSAENLQSGVGISEQFSHLRVSNHVDLLNNGKNLFHSKQFKCLSSDLEPDIKPTNFHHKSDNDTTEIQSCINLDSSGTKNELLEDLSVKEEVTFGKNEKLNGLFPLYIKLPKMKTKTEIPVKELNVTKKYSDVFEPSTGLSNDDVDRHDRDCSTKNNDSLIDIHNNLKLYLLPEFNDPIDPPRPPRAPKVDGDVELYPPFPIHQVTDIENAYSKPLYEFCLLQPCCVLRGLSKAIKIKLEMFSTSSLRQTYGEYNMEIRVQRKYKNQKSKSATSHGKLWNFQSRPSSMTINQFAKYQALSFLRASNNSLKSSSRKENIRFGTNVDFSNFDIWKEQLRELDKLPSFLKVHSPECNMLNHIGHSVLGVNTVQLYMKVPGCRTPGHQENNNFSAVNINIGPGSCEWFCIAEEYWGVVHDLCNKNGLNFSSGSWWPDLKDLASHNVPVYHVVQEPGDIIWIGPGTIHWVQSIGWCNNVAWNVGPMSEWQFRSAVERYEYNRLDHPYKSIIPMIQLSWNLARHFIKQDSTYLSIINVDLVERIFRVVSASLRHCKEIQVRIQKLGKKCVRQDRLPTDLAHYCEVCLIEVFNLIFACKSLVYCCNCAMKKNSILKDFYILQEYDSDELQHLIDEFASKIVTCSR